MHQLSASLRAVLECCYDGQRVSVNEQHEYDLASHLIERAIRMGLPPEDQRHLARVASVLVATAHRAFQLAYRPRGGLARRRARVDRWLTAGVERD